MIPRTPIVLAAALILVPVLVGCGMAPSYATAKMAEKGEWQVTPSVTVHSVHGSLTDREEEHEVSGSSLSIGAAATYGLTNSMNAGLRYERYAVDNGPRNFIRGDLKFGGERDKSAFSLGYGYLLGSEIHEVSLNAFYDFALGNGFVYCLSPQGSLLFVDGPSLLTDVTLYNSLSLPVAKNLTVMPQAGLAVTPLLFGRILALKVGVASRFTF